MKPVSETRVPISRDLSWETKPMYQTHKPKQCVKPVYPLSYDMMANIKICRFHRFSHICGGVEAIQLAELARSVHEILDAVPYILPLPYPSSILNKRCRENTATSQLPSAMAHKSAHVWFYTFSHDLPPWQTTSATFSHDLHDHPLCVNWTSLVVVRHRPRIGVRKKQCMTKS